MVHQLTTICFLVDFMEAHLNNIYITNSHSMTYRQTLTFVGGIGGYDVTCSHHKFPNTVPVLFQWPPYGNMTASQQKSQITTGTEDHSKGLSTLGSL